MIAAPTRASHGGRLGTTAISVSVTPDARTVTLQLEAWSELVSDWRPLWRDVADLFWRHQRRHVESEGAATGAKWADNSEETVPIVPGRHGGPYDAFKRRVLGGGRTLEVTGRLREAATGGAGSITDIGARSVSLGIDLASVPYALGHHRGDKVASALFRRDVQLKRRPLIRFDGRTVEEVSSEPRSFGRAIAQLAQAHVIQARRLALRGDPGTAPGKTIARVLAEPTR